MSRLPAACGADLMTWGCISAGATAAAKRINGSSADARARCAVMNIRGRTMGRSRPTLHGRQAHSSTHHIELASQSESRQLVLDHCRPCSVIGGHVTY